jgi:hypothetical protein
VRPGEWEETLHDVKSCRSAERASARWDGEGESDDGQPDTRTHLGFLMCIRL